MVEMSSPTPAVFGDRTRACLRVVSSDNVDQMADSPMIIQPDVRPRDVGERTMISPVRTSSSRGHSIDGRDSFPIPVASVLT